MIINRSIILVSVLLTTMLSGTAAAENEIYIFGTIGNTNSGIALGGLNRLDDEDSSYTLGAGYAFTPNISLEAAFQSFGSHDSKTECPPDFTCLVIPVST